MTDPRLAWLLDRLAEDGATAKKASSVECGCGRKWELDAQLQLREVSGDTEVWGDE